MQLSPHFTLAEMTASQTATRRGIKNTPDAAAIECLRALCINILEPVRVNFGRPVIVSSGYRSPRLNKAIGGSATSDHCFGRAADFTVSGISDADVARWIMQKLKFDQLILEFPPDGWVHCSYGGRMRQEVLTAKRIKGRTTYLQGLVL